MRQAATIPCVELLRYVLLGVIQGFTEFLPVSSTGHLVLAEHWLCLNPPGVITEVALHLATLISVVIVYRRDIVCFCLERNWRFLGLITLGTLVTAAMVWPVMDQLAALTETASAVPLVGSMLLLTGGWLVLADWRLRRHPTSRELGWMGALLVGIAQAVAALPGISRSGATIGAALQLGAERAAAARFSFLLSIPVIIGAGLIAAHDLQNTPLSDQLNAGGLALAFCAALVCGILAIHVVLWLLKRARLAYFAVYCFLLGAIAIAYSLLLQ
jgi:undecaprenyl-diphosphatase